MVETLKPLYHKERDLEYLPIKISEEPTHLVAKG
jgi:hypothetical protein